VFESQFLAVSCESRAAYLKWMSRAIDELCQNLPDRPCSGKTATELAQIFEGEFPNENECSFENLWDKVAVLISESVTVTHPNTAAHLHCPPLIPALAAEVVLSALNQSMDSFDQAPAATVLEERLVSWLCGQAGLAPGSGGIFTAGGTQSNYMALLLARDSCLDRQFHWPAQTRGLPPEARKLRILCSEVAHFTVEKSAAQLGLGTEAVVRVAADGAFRMRTESLHIALDELRTRDLVPMAIVATAGTTDFGSIDPLPEMASLAHGAGAWFHVDAAYGSVLLFSPRHRAQLRGIETADSISMDFHKLFWQPISCAAFLLRDASEFRYLKFHADYLNPETHEAAGIPDLVTRSIATTRRFDALKLWISLQALGRKKLGEMIDTTIALAAHAADCIRRNPRLELIHQPTLGCVVFRYCPADLSTAPDAFNAELRQRLFKSGLAVIGHTVLRGRQCLKLTCMNPCVSHRQMEELVELVVSQGSHLERERSSTRSGPA
jgi:L-2,4-diaminobutyrate decarboxylase